MADNHQPLYRGASLPRRSPGVSASALASVPPEVNTTSRASKRHGLGDHQPRVFDRPAGGPRDPRRGPRTDCPSVPTPRPSRPWPQPGAAWSHSNPDRPVDVSRMMIPWRGAAQPGRALPAQLAIPRPAQWAQRFEAHWDVQDACFLPLPHARTRPPIHRAPFALAQRRLIAPFLARLHLRKRQMEPAQRRLISPSDNQGITDA